MKKQWKYLKGNSGILVVPSVGNLGTFFISEVHILSAMPEPLFS